MGTRERDSANGRPVVRLQVGQVSTCRAVVCAIPLPYAHSRGAHDSACQKDEGEGSFRLRRFSRGPASPLIENLGGLEHSCAGKTAYVDKRIACHE